MKVAVLGLWHLGAVTAACLAEAGHDVVGLDFDDRVVSQLRLGRAMVHEPGLNELIADQVATGRLTFEVAGGPLPPQTELLWVGLDTPVDDDDRADVEVVMGQVGRLFSRLPPQTTVVVNSQLPVGSVARLELVAAQEHPDLQLRFAASPENLRLGKALETFRKAERMVVGVRGQPARACVERLLAPMGIPLEWMSIESAEMTKHAINAFLATSVVFANELAALCELVGADAKDVERGLKTESRIGPKAYLAPGGAFAGGTLARDVRYLNSMAADRMVQTPVLQAIDTSNRLHKHWAMRRMRDLTGGLDGSVVAIWGLTYKPGTDTLRRSHAVELCDELLQAGARLQVHDPVVPDLPARWAGQVVRFPQPLQALDGASVLVIGTEWPLYRELDPGDVLQPADGLLVLDANRFLPRWNALPGVRYAAVGTGPTNRCRS